MSQPPADPPAWSWKRFLGGMVRATPGVVMVAALNTYLAAERREWLSPLGRRDAMSLGEMAASFGAWLAGLFALLFVFGLIGPPILRVIMGRPTGQPRP